MQIFKIQKILIFCVPFSTQFSSEFLIEFLWEIKKELDESNEKALSKNVKSIFFFCWLPSCISLNVNH